jgi:hypothetical protein
MDAKAMLTKRAEGLREMAAALPEGKMRDGILAEAADLDEEIQYVTENPGNPLDAVLKMVEENYG